MNDLRAKHRQFPKLFRKSKSRLEKIQPKFVDAYREIFITELLLDGNGS